jgi:hypothetical protein
VAGWCRGWLVTIEEVILRERALLPRVEGAVAIGWRSLIRYRLCILLQFTMVWVQACLVLHFQHSAQSPRLAQNTRPLLQLSLIIYIYYLHIAQSHPKDPMLGRRAFTLRHQQAQSNHLSRFLRQNNPIIPHPCRREVAARLVFVCGYGTVPQLFGFLWRRLFALTLELGGFHLDEHVSGLVASHNGDF